MQQYAITIQISRNADIFSQKLVIEDVGRCLLQIPDWFITWLMHPHVNYLNTKAWFTMAPAKVWKK